MLQLFERIETCNNNRLLTLLADGYEPAFKLIYNRYSSRIFSLAIRYIQSEVAAQELVQEVFMKLWIHRCNIKQDTPIEAWLYTVAKNNTVNTLKRKAVEWKAINYLKNNWETHENNIEEMVAAKERNNLLNMGLKTLSPNQLKVYQLARGHNLSYVQIGEHLCISPLTVKTHMSRAISTLKLFFNNYSVANNLSEKQLLY